MEFEDAVTGFEEFFAERWYDEVTSAVRAGNEDVQVDMQAVDEYNLELMDMLRSDPGDALNAAEEAVNSLDVSSSAELSVRFDNPPEEDFVLLRNLRSKHIGRMVPVAGMIKRASQVKPEVVSATFECQSCAQQVVKEQDSTELKSPYKCESCGSRKFQPVEKQMTDTQSISLEESPDEREGSEQPSTLSVRLEGDLTDPDFQRKVIPGNEAVVVGEVKERPLKKKSKKFDMYMDANNLVPTQQEFEELELIEEEIEEIEEMASEDDIFDRIIDSIAPSIFGHRQVKKAIALQLFGGVKKTREDGVKSRGDIHILLIGEPGTGKSQLLQFAGELAPKGRYVVGKSSTGAGLTASVVKEESTGEFSLEAGAVVLAHKGMAAIDEIDKMDTQDRSSLHEAMEQQCFAPDTQVQLGDGRTKTIQEIVDPRIAKLKDRSERNKGAVVKLESGVELASSDLGNGPETAEASVAGKREAPERMLNIQMGNGRSLEVTPDHPFYTVENGEIGTVEARDLDEDSFVLAPRRIPIDGEEQDLGDIDAEKGRKDVDVPEHNSPALARFAGYQVSDGGYEVNRGEKNGFNFTNSSDTLVEDYIEAVDSLFDVDPYVRKRGDRKEVRIVSKELKNWLESLGDILEHGQDKKIPERLMKCRREDIKLLLRAFFDGDGGVQHTRRGYRVGAVVENRELMVQVQNLLHRFGIHSNLRQDQDVWRLDISRYTDLQRFYEKIGFKSDKKQDRLQKAVQHDRDPKEPVPGLSSLLMRALRKLGVGQSETFSASLCHGDTMSRRRFLRGLETAKNRLRDLENRDRQQGIESLRQRRQKYGISMREVAEEVGVSHSLIGYWEKNGTKREDEYADGLETCLEKREKLRDDLEMAERLVRNHRFLRVKSVDRRKPDYDHVYDLTVPENHNFVAEGAVVHNSISVSKANIQATLNAETAILAAGNPKLGRFDPYEPIPQQIEIGDTLLSRFDFIFPVKDEPDEDRDRKLSEQVLKNHIEPEESTAEISADMLRKYIAYSRRIRPDLTDEAAEVIQEFYVDMRKKGGGEEGSSVPITARQLEALVRIAEASARAELSEEVTEDDAERAVDILTYCLEQVGVDPETGEYDIDMVESGVSGSQRNRQQTVKQIINDATDRQTAIQIEEVLDRADDQGVDRQKAEEIINRMQREGDLFEPEQGKVQKI